MPESQGRAGCGFLGGTIILDVLMRLRDPDLEICQSWSQTVQSLAIFCARDMDRKKSV